MVMRPLVKFCLAAIVYFLPLTNATAEEHKRVLILHSVGREFRPWNEYAKYMRAELIGSRRGRSTYRNTR